MILLKDFDFIRTYSEFYFHFYFLFNINNYLSYLAQKDAGGKPSLAASISEFKTDGRRRTMEYKMATSGIVRTDNKFTSNQQVWKCVLGDEFKDGVNEWGFKMLTRGYPSGTSLIVGMAPSNLNLDSQYPGYSSYLGFSIGDQGSNWGTPAPVPGIKKPSGRFFDENDEVRCIVDYPKNKVEFWVNKQLVATFNTCLTGPMCPAISMFGNGVIEWID